VPSEKFYFIGTLRKSKRFISIPTPVRVVVERFDDKAVGFGSRS